MQHLPNNTRFVYMFLACLRTPPPLPPNLFLKKKTVLFAELCVFVWSNYSSLRFQILRGFVHATMKCGRPIFLYMHTCLVPIRSESGQYFSARRQLSREKKFI